MPGITLKEFFATVDAIVPDEYGCVAFPQLQCTIDGKSRSARRLVLERKLGRPILPGHVVLDTCNYYLCVNAKHLYEATHADKGRKRRLYGRQTGMAYKGVRAR
jgi:hypothetical protein